MLDAGRTTRFFERVSTSTSNSLRLQDAPMPDAGGEQEDMPAASSL